MLLKKNHGEGILTKAILNIRRQVNRLYSPVLSSQNYIVKTIVDSIYFTDSIKLKEWLKILFLNGLLFLIAQSVNMVYSMDIFILTIKIDQSISRSEFILVRFHSVTTKPIYLGATALS